MSFWLNKDVTSDTQYQILGATTAFGSIDMSNEIVESQWAIEQVIEKLNLSTMAQVKIRDDIDFVERLENMPKASLKIGKN